MERGWIVTFTIANLTKSLLTQVPRPHKNISIERRLKFHQLPCGRIFGDETLPFCKVTNLSEIYRFEQITWSLQGYNWKLHPGAEWQQQSASIQMIALQQDWWDCNQIANLFSSSLTMENLAKFLTVVILMELHCRESVNSGSGQKTKVTGRILYLKDSDSIVPPLGLGTCSHEWEH